mgnify:CR=1 FL=1
MSRPLMAAVLAGVLAQGAQAAEFRVLADHNTDFANISTFRIERVSIVRSAGETVDASSLDGLRAVVREYLLREGLRESDEAADVLVTVTGGLQVGMQNRELQGMPYFEGDRWHILPREEAETDPVTSPAAERYGQGSLQIDIRAGDDRVIWRAHVRDVVNLPVSRDDLTRALDPVFAHYPPPPPK